MTHRLIQRLSRVLRLPALAVLLLAVLVNPVFASLGDLHELGSGEAHLHVVGEHPDNAPGHDHDHDEVDQGDLLHALMHASHCCGHLTAIVPAAFAVPGMPPASTAPLADPVPVPPSRPASLLRPPIVA